MKLFIKKWCLLLSLLVVGCTSEAYPGVSDTPGNPIHQVTILLEGGSPVVYVSGCGEQNKEYRGNTITLFLQEGKVITATSLEYMVDNSNNYGAPNEDVKSKLTISVDNKVVKQGKDWISYYIVPAKYK